MQTHNLLKHVKRNSSELEQTNKQIGIDEYQRSKHLMSVFENIDVDNIHFRPGIIQQAHTVTHSRIPDSPPPPKKKHPTHLPPLCPHRYLLLRSIGQYEPGHQHGRFQLPSLADHQVNGEGRLSLHQPRHQLTQQLRVRVVPQRLQSCRGGGGDGDSEW